MFIFETKAIIKEHGDNMAASFFVSRSATSEASIMYQQGSAASLFCSLQPSPGGYRDIKEHDISFDVSQRIEIE